MRLFSVPQITWNDLRCVTQGPVGRLSVAADADGDMGQIRAFGLFSGNITCAIRLATTDQNGKPVDVGMRGFTSGFGAPALMGRTRRPRQESGGSWLWIRRDAKY